MNRLDGCIKERKRIKVGGKKKVGQMLGQLPLRSLSTARALWVCEALRDLLQDAGELYLF